MRDKAVDRIIINEDYDTSLIMKAIESICNVFDKKEVNKINNSYTYNADTASILLNSLGYNVFNPVTISGFYYNAMTLDYIICNTSNDIVKEKSFSCLKLMLQACLERASENVKSLR